MITGGFGNFFFLLHSYNYVYVLQNQNFISGNLFLSLLFESIISLDLSPTCSWLYPNEETFFKFISLKKKGNKVSDSSTQESNVGFALFWLQFFLHYVQFQSKTHFYYPQIDIFSFNMCLDGDSLEVSKERLKNILKAQIFIAYKKHWRISIPCICARDTALFILLSVVFPIIKTETEGTYKLFNVFVCYTDFSRYFKINLPFQNYLISFFPSHLSHIN